MVEISTKKNTREKVHLGELKLTQYNTTHKELVKEATFAEIQEYISWVRCSLVVVFFSELTDPVNPDSPQGSC